VNLGGALYGAATATITSKMIKQKAIRASLLRQKCRQKSRKIMAPGLVEILSMAVAFIAILIVSVV
jgi:hypothetical protein